MVGAKSTQTRVVGIITDKVHPTYNVFPCNNSFHEKCVGCILSMIIPTAPLCTFCRYHPYLLFQFT